MIACALWIVMACLALAPCEPVAIGLLLGPMLLLLALWLGDNSPEAFQMIGFFYPVTLCGIVRLIDDTAIQGPHPNPPPEYRGRGMKAGRRMCYAPVWTAALALLALAWVGLRVPCYAGSVKRYAGPLRPRGQEFSMRETDRLVNAIGSEPVEVDFPSVSHLLFVVVELHNRGVQLNFTPQAFNTAFAYMRWQPPTYPPSRLRLRLLSQTIPPGWRVMLRAQPFCLLARQ
jgi:hypothetical protein